MTKRITLDTNNLFGESANLYIEIVDNETNIITTSYPVFSELMDEGNPTGIYSCDVDLEYGNYYITIKHTTLDKKGVVHAVIADDNHSVLEDEIMGLIKDTDDGTTFA